MQKAKRRKKDAESLKTSQLKLKQWLEKEQTNVKGNTVPWCTAQSSQWRQV